MPAFATRRRPIAHGVEQRSEVVILDELLAPLLGIDQIVLVIDPGGSGQLLEGSGSGLLQLCRARGAAPWAVVGAALAAADLDGDAKAEAFVGAPAAQANQGRVYVLGLGPDPLVLAPAAGERPPEPECPRPDPSPSPSSS